MLAVLDVGNSFAKVYLMDGNDVKDFKKKEVHVYNMLEVSLDLFDEFRGDCSHVIVLSMSDSVVYEDKKGNRRWMPALIDIGWQKGLPDYSVSGHPHFESLKGAANQMLWLQKEVGLENIKRIVPVSTYLASKIAGLDWQSWDITHASNSGFYDYRQGQWAAEAYPFIEAGVIGEKIMPCYEWVSVGTPWVMLGGHDSTFINAMDTPYSTKPYISCGTWLTVSVQTSVRSRGFDVKADGESRFIAAPNGAVLEQLCFRSLNTEISIKRVTEFLRARLPKDINHAPIQIFGAWGDVMASAMHEEFNVERVSVGLIEDTSLARTAAAYLQTRITRDQDHHGCLDA